MKSPQNDDKKQEPKINYRTPIYLQLREIVRTKIEDGEYLPGTAIPSENDMAATYGISRITVRSAVDALVNEGLLRRVQGKGVFVVGNKIEQAIEEFSGFVPFIGKSKDNLLVWFKVSTDIFLIFALFLMVNQDENDAYNRKISIANENTL